MTSSGAGKANRIAAIALVVMAVGIAGLMVVIRDSKTEGARVYFDNGLDTGVNVTVDANPPISIPAHSAKADDLSVGKHTFKVTDEKGQPVETFDADIAAAQGITLHRFVYNVAKKSKYQMAHIAYGNTARPDDEITVIGDARQFFELPDTNSEFLPVDVVSEKRKVGTVVALIFHAPLHKSWPCCTNAHAVLDAPKNGEKGR